MKLRQKMFCAGLLILFCFGASGEPAYKGRPLKLWLHQYWMASEEEQKLKNEAASAVREIGARKAVPELLSLARVKDGPVRQWLEKNSEKYHLGFLQPRSVTELQLDAITGFEILGTNAAFAAPQLANLLHDKDLAFVAIRCLEHLGKAAEPALCQCLTNQDRSVREWALGPLASVTETVELYVARITPLLRDPDLNVRYAALSAIGAQTNAPDLALPILIPALNDAGMARTAAEQLGNFGTNAADALPGLVRLVKDGEDNAARAALKTMPLIARGQPCTSIQSLWRLRCL